MTNTAFQGLTQAQVLEKQSLGLTNDSFDTHNTTYVRIAIRNIFSIINIVVFPLVGLLLYYQLYTDALAFSVFLIINSLVSALDEVRAKKQLEKLKSQFQRTARVIRDGQQMTISAAEVVEGDYLVAGEGEAILADGKIVAAEYLQVDESMLTGEADYLPKQVDDTLLSGGYIVTGRCVYVAEKVGKSNYLNKLGEATLGKAEARSSLQINGDKLIFFLVAAAIVVGAINFTITNNEGFAGPEKILSLTTIISLIIPQTLIFLFTITFTVSSIKLYQTGVLVQKTGSIPDLAEVDVICFDKTGTLTTNKMELKQVYYFGGLEESAIGTFYNSVRDQIVGVNKTQELLHDYYGKFAAASVNNFFQVPFTSKNKYSLLTGEINNLHATALFGAPSLLLNKVDGAVRTQMQQLIEAQEMEGNRVLVAIYYQTDEAVLLPKSIDELGTTANAAVYIIQEELNPGVGELIHSLNDQGIAVKIISGDSLNSVSRIAQKVGIDTAAIVDLSNMTEAEIIAAVEDKIIFTRAKPEDKLLIIRALKAKGHKVAMVGDGINDVLGLKGADVSIAMESGAKITREVADLVLLSNNYQRIPSIFYEGENIIYNLKLSTQMFLAKAFTGIFLGLFFSLQSLPVPLHPSSTLIFSFLGTSGPSYVLVFSRQQIKNRVGFFMEVMRRALPTSIIFSAAAILLYFMLRNQGEIQMTINTALIVLLLSMSVIFSLFLVYVSGKLSSLWVAILTYVILMAIGIYQTILPLAQYAANEKLALIGFMFIGTIIILGLFWTIVKPKRLLVKLAGVVLSLIWIPIASIFPFQSYYQVTNISIDIYLPIALISLAGLVLFAISEWLFVERD